MLQCCTLADITSTETIVTETSTVSASHNRPISNVTAKHFTAYLLVNQLYSVHCFRELIYVRKSAVLITHCFYGYALSNCIYVSTHAESGLKLQRLILRRIFNNNNNLKSKQLAALSKTTIKWFESWMPSGWETSSACSCYAGTKRSHFLYVFMYFYLNISLKSY